MLTIPILEGILKEHGLEEFVRRINKLLNINLPISDFDLKTTCTKDSIRIESAPPIIIAIEDEVYKITTEYSTYRTIKYYYNKELIRKLFVFNTEDEKLLVLDHIDNGNFKTTRINKTTEDDKNFNQGEYEREITTYPVIPININSHYLNKENNEEEERTIDLAGANMYYHHYNGNKEDEYFQESAMCMDIPFLKISGHIRLIDDLLVNSLDQKKPNILIRGINLDEDGNPLEFYQVFIDFNAKGLRIKDVTVDYKTNEIEGNETFAKTKRRRFDSNLLQALIFSIAKAVKKSHLSKVLEELEHIKEALLVEEHRKIRDFGTIELMMNIIPDPNKLAFNIYENQSKYENAINSELELPIKHSLK